MKMSERLRMLGTDDIHRLVEAANVELTSRKQMALDELRREFVQKARALGGELDELRREFVQKARALGGELECSWGKPGPKLGSHKRVKYADANGNKWSGCGNVPLWLRAELNAGKTLDSFLVA